MPSDHVFVIMLWCACSARKGNWGPLSIMRKDEGERFVHIDQEAALQRKHYISFHYIVPTAQQPHPNNLVGGQRYVADMG